MLNVSMDVSSGADFAGVGDLLGPLRVTALGGLSDRLYAQTGYPFSSTDINSPIFAVFSLPFRR